MNSLLTRHRGHLLSLIAAAVLAAPTLAQDTPQIITVPLSKPGEPMMLDIDILSAHIEVIGEDRDDVELAISVEQGSRKIVTPSGTKSLTAGAYSMEVEEEDNVVSVDTDWRADRVNVVARVPQRADLELSTTNDGVIIVNNVAGTLQLDNTNGPITASGIRGSVIAESVNEAINVSFASIDSDSAMSLETLNGDITLGLPSQAGAQLHIDSSRGEILSDFEVDVQPSEPIVERRNNRGGVEVRVESVIIADVNGGGPVIKLKSLNGDILIRESGN